MLRDTNPIPRRLTVPAAYLVSSGGVESEYTSISPIVGREVVYSIAHESQHTGCYLSYYKKGHCSIVKYTFWHQHGNVVSKEFPKTHDTSTIQKCLEKLASGESIFEDPSRVPWWDAMLKSTTIPLDNETQSPDNEHDRKDPSGTIMRSPPVDFDAAIDTDAPMGGDTDRSALVHEQPNRSNDPRVDEAVGPSTMEADFDVGETQRNLRSCFEYFVSCMRPITVDKIADTFLRSKNDKKLSVSFDVGLNGIVRSTETALHDIDANSRIEIGTVVECLDCFQRIGKQLEKKDVKTFKAWLRSRGWERCSQELFGTKASIHCATDTMPDPQLEPPKEPCGSGCDLPELTPVGGIHTLRTASNVIEIVTPTQCDIVLVQPLHFLHDTFPTIDDHAAAKDRIEKELGDGMYKIPMGSSEDSGHICVLHADLKYFYSSHNDENFLHILKFLVHRSSACMVPDLVRRCTIDFGRQDTRIQRTHGVSRTFVIPIGQNTHIVLHNAKDGEVTCFVLHQQGAARVNDVQVARAWSWVSFAFFVEHTATEISYIDVVEKDVIALMYVECAISKYELPPNIECIRRLAAATTSYEMRLCVVSGFVDAFHSASG
jgi:hypothetical protein